MSAALPQWAGRQQRAGTAKCSHCFPAGGRGLSAGGGATLRAATPFRSSRPLSYRIVSISGTDVVNICFFQLLRMTLLRSQAPQVSMSSPTVEVFPSRVGVISVVRPSLIPSPPLRLYICSLIMIVLEVLHCGRGLC